MDQTQTAHDPFAERIIAQLRDYHTSFITNDDIFHNSGAVDQEGNLATQVAGEFNKACSKLNGAEFSNRYTSAVKTFQ
jgi:hypothetical protein